MKRKTTKNDSFTTVFWSFWVLGPILAHQTTKFKLSGQFCFSRHPWGPWGRLSSGVICISKTYQLFYDSGATLVDFFKIMKMVPNVSFISTVIKKVFLSVWIATFSNFLQKCTLWRHNHGTSQSKIGQCANALLMIILLWYLKTIGNLILKPRTNSNFFVRSIRILSDAEKKIFLLDVHTYLSLNFEGPVLTRTVNNYSPL